MGGVVTEGVGCAVVVGLDLGPGRELDGAGTDRRRQTVEASLHAYRQRPERAWKERAGRGQWPAPCVVSHTRRLSLLLYSAAG